MPTAEPRDHPTSHHSGHVIGPVFLALAAWFLWGGALEDIPSAATPPFDAAQLSTAPRRAVLPSPPTVHINGFDRTCMDCHRLIPPREKAPEILLQHRDIVLHHGINRQCRNCHAVADRDRLILRSGEEIAFDEDVRLCGQCHGPVYRDWQRGMHGRTNGYWDASRGAMRRLRCTQCHDPHQPRVPAMDPLAPLPGPHTLRMGAQPEGAAVERPLELDPLRRSLHLSVEEETQIELEPPVEALPLEEGDR